MKTILILILALAPLTLTAQGPSPVEQRLREQLKAIMQRANTAETAQATLQAEKAAMETKIKDLGKNVAERAEELRATKESASKKEEDLGSQLAEKSNQLEAKGKLHVQAQKFLDETRARLEKTESERASLQSENLVLKRIVTDQRVKNAKILEIAQEILTRYKNFGLGTAITAREPFTGITRARLESLVDEYDAQLAAARIRLDGTSPKPANEKNSASKP